MDLLNHLPLAQLSPELKALPGVTGPSPGYRKLSEMARDGSIRTVIVNGRHYVLKADVPRIAQAVGMLPLQAERSSRPRRSAATVEQAVA